MSSPAVVVVNGRGARRARRGHPWVYRDDVVDAQGGAGDIVRAVDRAGAFCCWAAFSPHSKIVLRRLSRAENPPDAVWWSAALRRAVARRAGPAGVRACRRLVHSDADGFPGLTIDQYGEHLVLQATTAWADRAAADLARELARVVDAKTILARNDAAARALEGLPQGVTPLVGRPPDELDLDEGGSPRIVDVWRGHKTGLYLDQQENHAQSPRWLQGRVLDLFSAEAGFAAPLAAAGANVLAVEQSASLIDRARRAAERSGLSPRLTFWERNAFEALAELDGAGERFDAVIVDPPPFARRRDETTGAVRGYADLHRRALRILAPKGRVLSFCCSFAIDALTFEAAARAGAEDAAASLRVLGRPGAAADHPEVLEAPESRYLKGLLLEREDA